MQDIRRFGFDSRGEAFLSEMPDSDRMNWWETGEHQRDCKNARTSVTLVSMPLFGKRRFDSGFTLLKEYIHAGVSW